ncbi:polysaccharide pyruvyl transferase family protein [Mobilicoccus massiliensis]|uniref:polysaccharide pyruvyl transferase family protein n=1 Tax=Mobilicoccus massiliensis TaxID=1522310 RepID=UPI00058BBECC|nr:polysaccharide pyruvyl transferase family protein [Mobilicoccus massiliensis]
MSKWESAIERVGRTVARPRMGYTGRVRSQGREAERIARAVLNASCRPDAVLVSTFWWEKVKNFGDLLTPYLLRDCGIVPVLTPPAQADLVGVGSLVQHLPPDFGGALWGTGLVHDRRTELPDATCLALRGDLTRDRMGSPHVDALGDPGLLVSRRVRRPGVSYDVGVVAHYVHADDEWLHDLVSGHPDHANTVLPIDVAQRPSAVARQVASCRAIVSTSLHGVITADAFGIPAAWIRMPRSLYGGDFKFHDHESVVRPSGARDIDAADVSSLAQVAAAARPADMAAVERAQDGLIAAAARIPDVVRHRRVPTWQIPLTGRGSVVHTHV